ncbi:MAG: hypothetical protein RIR62_363 [Pseudomonadota bacterium]|jgi:pimeloyl-ACP methyl ester carboxylesterase
MSETVPETVPEIVLIHGAAHGAWCWHRVVPLLQAMGHRVRAIDLPSHGDDPTPPETVTLQDYTRATLAAAGGRAILVGHSMAGVVITAAAEAAPDRIAGLIYLCAHLPRAGWSVASSRKAAARQPLAGTFLIAPDRKTFTFDPAAIRDRFYHDCAEEDVALARARLCPQAILPQETPVPSTARAETLPRFYIRCSEDRAIPPEWQAELASPLPAGHVSTLPCGHSPFFALPEALARRIDAIARQIDSGTVNLG